MTKVISTEISDSVLQFAPAQAPVSFGITAFNDSDQFASFQVSLTAPGVDPNRQGWYRLFPAVSAKIPPGDRTQFQAQLLTVPPVPGGFVGTMNLTVKIYSTELRSESRQDLRLIITGEGLLPPKVTLAKSTFKAAPQEEIEITARVYNPNRKSLETVFELVGVPPAWFPDGIQKTLTLVPAEEKPLLFLCRLPGPTQTPSGLHPFSLQLITPETALPPQSLSLEVLPSGYAEFRCTPLEDFIPEQAGRWRNPRQGSTDFDLTFHNHSNLTLTGMVAVTDEAEERRHRRDHRRRFPWPRWLTNRSSSPETEPETDNPSLPPNVSLSPPQAIAAPGDTLPLTLTVQKRLPWLGWTRIQRLEVAATLVDTPLDLRNDQEVIELRVLPVIPFWLQVLGAIVGLFLGGLLWGLIAQRGHTQAVNSVQFNGTGTEVISGSSDQTVRRWQVRRNRLQPRGAVDRNTKAIRTVRYRPVNNDWLAAGFENGAVMLHSLLDQRETTFDSALDDRVFDLEFSRDARTLWSAHGSGQVQRWSLTAAPQANDFSAPAQTIEADFAVSAIALVGEGETLMAVGGRNQKLAFVDLVAEEAYTVPYRNGTQTDFINSLETALEAPGLLVTGDSSGYISLWEPETCLANPTQCVPIDEWLAHGGTAVRAVALSPDGCFIASVGDDGAAKLWALTGAHERQPESIDGQVLRRSQQPLNAVDVSQQGNRLLVVSGGDDRRVRLNRVRLTAADRCQTRSGG